jgi:ribose 5-phosphate isomerase B
LIYGATWHYIHGMKIDPTQKTAIASDHAGYELKELIKAQYPDWDFLDLGCHSEESVDYPDFGKAIGEAVRDGTVDQAILICGSGIGVSIAANRFAEVRAALCMNEEQAESSRTHNDANVLVLAARLTPAQDVYKFIDIFFSTEFEGGRHQRRVEKLSC